MQGLKILLAEDNRDHRELLLLALTVGAPSITVTTASSRDEVLSAASQGTFDCVILDFNLPPHSAPEIIEDLTGLIPDVPIIVVSSSEMQSVVIESMRTGVADFVPKFTAIKGETLRNRVRAAVTQADAAREERRAHNRRLIELRHEADTDVLTGLATRRYAERFITNSGTRTDRREQTGVVMLDLDHFKQVNDGFGHAAGDEVLRQVGKILRRHVSPTDLVARWGGEEFIAFRQSATLTETWLWAQKLRDAVRSEVSVQNGPERVTISIGIDVIPLTELSLDTINRADRALYLAKEHGRDRVCTWDMVSVLESAYRLQTDASLSPTERIKAFLAILDPVLSDTQREHLGKHSDDVVRLTRSVAARAGLDDDELADLELAAEFHDIGKVAIPDELLSLPRTLSLDEKRIVDEHAYFGSAIFDALGLSPRSAAIVAAHHIRFEDLTEDDAGFRLSSILIACDALVTMLSDRPYANRIPIRDAHDELKNCSGSQFDPEVVRLLRSTEHTHAGIRLAA